MDGIPNLEKIMKLEVEYILAILKENQQKCFNQGKDYFNENKYELAIQTIRKAKLFSNSIAIYYGYIYKNINKKEVKPIFEEILFTLSSIIKDGVFIDLVQLQFTTFCIIQFEIDIKLQKNKICKKIRDHIEITRKKEQQID